MVNNAVARPGYGAGTTVRIASDELQERIQAAVGGDDRKYVHTVTTSRTHSDPGLSCSSSSVSDDQLLLKRLMVNRPTKRQQAGAGVGNVSEGYPACNNVSNEVLSCFPEEDTVLLQGEYSKFIWNTNYPIYIGAGYVDIHLFNAGSEEELFAWRNVSTYRGSVGYRIDDAWLPAQTTWTQGQTSTHSYYFVIATQGADVNAGARHQATFEVLQTSPPATLASQLAAATTSLSASPTTAPSQATATPTPTSFQAGVIPPAIASSIVLSEGELGTLPLTLTGDLSTITNLAGLTSVAASVSSAQSSLSSVISSLSAAGSPIPSSLLSSLSAFSTSNAGIDSTQSSVVSSIARTRGPSILQDNNSDNGDPVPKWAIALVAVLGFFALLAALVGLWFVLRRVRRKRRESQYIEAKGGPILGDDSVATSITPTGGALAIGSGQEKEARPLSESFSDGTGNTGRMSSASGPGFAGAIGASSTHPARAGSAASGQIGSGAGGMSALAALAKRSDSPAMRSIQRSNTDSPHHFSESSPGSARATGSTPGTYRPGIINKASSRSLGTNASTGAGTIAPYDAAIMADAYRNVLRKPEFPHRNDDSSDSGEKSTRAPEEEGDTPPILAGAVIAETIHTPKASGTTTPMAFADSASEGEDDRRNAAHPTDSKDSTLGTRGRYGDTESDEEHGTEANELLRHELANEGTSVKSNTERKRPEIRYD